jgi:hypothetical protein
LRAREGHQDQHGSLPQKGPLGGRQLRGVIAAWKQMPVNICRHLDAGVPEPALHHLDRQFEAAVGPAIDAPRSIEMAERMQPGIFGAAALAPEANRDAQIPAASMSVFRIVLLLDRT